MGVQTFALPIYFRYRCNGWDDRFVVRDVSVTSFLAGQPSDNRLSALYGDFKNERLRFDARLGRQSSSSGAVLGRFDGATTHIGIGPAWRVGAFGGTPAEPTLGSRKTFRLEEHTSELQSLMRISYAGFCLKQKNNTRHQN